MDEIAGRIAEIVEETVDLAKTRKRGADEFVVALRILAAIRDATDTMVDAGMAATEYDGTSYPRRVWAAMIDQAIGDALDEAHRIGREAALEEKAQLNDPDDRPAEARAADESRRG